MLGDDVAAGLVELRAHAESQHRDTIKIERKTGASAMDGYERVDVWQNVGTAKVRVLRRALDVRTAETGGQKLDLWHIEMRARWNLDVRKGDRVTFTEADPLSDPPLLGAVVTVTVVDYATQPVARRFRGVLDADRQQ